MCVVILLSGCAGTAKVKLYGNESVGDDYYSTVTPEGIVREVSHTYHILLPFPGMSGNFYFKFKAIAEGEAEIVINNNFRGGEAGYFWGGEVRQVAVYKAAVDKWKKLTLTQVVYTHEDE